MSEFYAVLTALGLNELLSSISEKRAFNAVYMGVGDSNGIFYEPTTTQISLKNEKFRAELYKKGKNINKGYLYFCVQIPSSVGDFTVREVGLFDSNNNMLAIAKYPETVKRKADSESDKSLNIELQIFLSNKAINQIVVDDSGILVTKDELDIELEAKANIDLSNLSMQGQSILNSKANQDLSNLTPEGEKHFLSKTLITNCLTETPQRVKYTLENGILTIKAGSEIIKPIGFETDETTKKFNFITTGTDKHVASYQSQGKTLLYLTNDNNLDYMKLDSNFDGEVAPAGFGTYAKWYDSNQNLVKATTDGGASWISGYSLPFMLIDVAQDGTVNSVLQVFDNFGFIGLGTIWVNKGVKGLIPNYRNEDKTLKNIEIAVNELSITTINMPDIASFNAIRLNSNGTINHVTYLGEFEKAPAPSGFWGAYYNSTENVMYYNSQGTWIPVQSLICTKGFSNTSLQVKQPFRAVDDNVLAARAMGAVVPSGEKIQVTVGANGAEYVAPVNGYFQAGCSNSSSDAWIEVTNVTKHLNNAVIAARWANYGLNDRVICEKGDRIKFQYRNVTSKSAFFVPMKGELDVYSA